MSERTATLSRSRPNLPLRYSIGALSTALIAASYPVALIEHGLIVGPHHIPAPVVRLALYTLLHIAGLAAIGITVLWCEHTIVRRAARRLSARYQEAAED